MNENIQTTSRQQKTNQSGYFIKRIGNTTFKVAVHFSGKSTETAKDKIYRLIRNESTTGKAAGK